MKIDPLALVQAIERYLVVRGTYIYIYIYYTVTCVLLLGIVTTVSSVESVKPVRIILETDGRVPINVSCSQGRRLRLQRISFLGQTSSCCKQFSLNTNRSVI